MFLTAYPLSNETPSRSRFLNSGSSPTIQRLAHSEGATSGNGPSFIPSFIDGEATVVEGSTNIPTTSLLPTSVLAHTVAEQLNLDQSEGVVGCVLHSSLA